MARNLNKSVQGPKPKKERELNTPSMEGSVGTIQKCSLKHLGSAQCFDARGEHFYQSLLWGKSYSLIKYIGDSYDPTLTNCVCSSLFDEHVLFGKLQSELV